MGRLKLVLIINLFFLGVIAQTNIYRDTVPVFESGTKLSNPWAGGINFASFTQMDFNQDGKQDLVVYDKICGSGGKLRAYKNVGSNGISNYKHAPEYQNQFPVVDQWALFFDYNNDGKADIFTYTTGGVRLLKNNSIGTTLIFNQVGGTYLKTDYNPNGAPNIANIPCNSVGLPGITDVDNDGDLDILTYSSVGTKIEFHKNMSMELYGVVDSLVFDMVDNCWGDFDENTCAINLYQCPYPKLYHDAINGIKNSKENKTLHAGSCIMCFDRDGDGDKDLILGDVSCPTVFYVENTGSSSNAHITDTTILYPNYPNKASTTPIKMNSFPCTYWLDIDNDGFKDMIVSPNSIAGAENYQSVWYYKNASSTPTVNFTLQQKNFLQDGMIELGEGAYPVLFDADADGKKDLIVGNIGYYTGGTNKSKLAYYKNIGTTTAPSFSLITRDYQGLSSYNIFMMAPTFGDLDNDGDKDMIVGDFNGRLNYFENTGGAGNPAVFASNIALYGSIDIGNYAFPQLFDADNDGDLDLIIGTQTGKITYYKNTPISGAPNFVLQTASFGGVDVKQFGFTTGYSVPFMYRDGIVTKLIVGSEMGNIYLYNNIDGNLTGTFNRVDTNLYKINDGARCAPFFEDITGDGSRDLFLGNYAGGVAFFNSTNVNAVGVKELDYSEYVNVFPNPANDKITIAINDYTMEEVNVKLLDIVGREVRAIKTFNKTIYIDVSEFSKGVYFIQIESKEDHKLKSTTKKIILQ